jgi:hypothetical protein
MPHVFWNWLRKNTYISIIRSQKAYHVYEYIKTDCTNDQQAIQFNIRWTFCPIRHVGTIRNIVYGLNNPLHKLPSASEKSL